MARCKRSTSPATSFLQARPGRLIGLIGPDALYDTNPGPATVFPFDTRVATLPIPAAGTYVIWSKVWLVRTTAGQPTQQLCVLRSTDGAEDYIQSTGPTASPTMMANLLVHEFGGPGTVNLFCFATGQSKAFDAKIAAIKVGSLRTTSG